MNAFGTVCVHGPLHQWNVESQQHFHVHCGYQRAFLVAQMVKHLPAIQETWVWSLGQEAPLEKEMAIHSSIPAWRIDIKGKKRAVREGSLVLCLEVFNVCLWLWCWLWAGQRWSYGLYWLRYVPSITNLLKAYYKKNKRMPYFVKCLFCIYWDTHMIFAFILLMWCIPLIDLCVLSHSCNPGRNPTWSWYWILLIYAVGFRFLIFLMISF